MQSMASVDQIYLGYPDLLKKISQCLLYAGKFNKDWIPCTACQTNETIRISHIVG